MDTLTWVGSRFCLMIIDDVQQRYLLRLSLLLLPLSKLGLGYVILRNFCHLVTLF